MLAAANRLRLPADYRVTIRRGRRVGGPLLVVHLLRTETTDPPRVGFVVSRAVGPSVTRNLVKRRLRHLIREQLTTLPGGAAVVVRAQPAAARASYDELSREVTRCLGKAMESGAAA